MLVQALVHAYRFYLASFAGFGREIWLLALVTFINRAGTMVVPFLSLYLTKDMGLSLDQVGWVMSSFGAGSVVGSWLGGKLSDKLSFYDVMIGALLTSGIAFIGLQFVHEFEGFCIAIFFLLVLSDAFRPAMFVAIRSYARPENRTRAVTLIRLAINLGFSLGPALGGLIIAGQGYAGLFWVDGLSCIGAMLLLWAGLPRKKALLDGHAVRKEATRSAYRDKPYLFFLLTVMLISIPFLQYFSTVPLFYSSVHHLSEAYIGLLLASNGLLIFLVEMPLVKYCEDRGFGVHGIIRWSVLLFAASFAVFNLVPTVAFLWVGMFLMTVGEMLNFPFMNRFAYDRAERGKPGSYMGLFTVAWSMAHIIGHTLGFKLVKHIGFFHTWYAFVALLLVCVGLLYAVERMVKREAAGS